MRSDDVDWSVAQSLEEEWLNDRDERRDVVSTQLSGQCPEDSRENGSSADVSAVRVLK